MAEVGRDRAAAAVEVPVAIDIEQMHALAV